MRHLTRGYPEPTQRVLTKVDTKVSVQGDGEIIETDRTSNG
jgi:hypothetical protein